MADAEHMQVVSGVQAVPHVAIAGGGFAGLEAAVALRALLDDRVELTLISPDEAFIHRPLATAEIFGAEAPRTYDLRVIAGQLGAAFHRTALDAVLPHDRRVRLTSGLELDYDALVLAVGGRRRAAVPGALTFRDQRDASQLQHVLAEIREGEVRRAAFVVPSRHCWPVPAYELGLFLAGHAEQRGLDAAITVVAPEHEPLQWFGFEASRLVAELLAERGVRFVGGSLPAEVQRDGSLQLESDGRIEADRVIAIPELVGQRISGIPASWGGFVATDDRGQVQGLSDVYAAGDMTTHPIKHGGLATQQADRIAETIAERFGGPGRLRRAALVVQVRLLGGRHPLFLRAELDEQGQFVNPSVRQLGPGEVTAANKVAARYLTPYLEHLQPAAAATG